MQIILVALCKHLCNFILVPYHPSFFIMYHMKLLQQKTINNKLQWSVKT